MSNKGIFIKNKLREQQQLVGDSAELYQPEYERLNRHPAVSNVSEDFKNVAINRSGRDRKSVTLTAPAPAVFNTFNSDDYLGSAVSGPNYQRIWTDGPNEEDIPYDAVPSPPSSEFSHEETLQYEEESTFDNLSAITPGSYCIIMGNEFVEVPDLDSVEELVERALFANDSGISIDDIVIFKRMQIKVGVSVDD